MKQQLIFTCPITKYYIEYVIDAETNTAFINTIISDYQHMKPLMTLLRSSIDNLEKKGVKKIRQTISQDEWDAYLKNKTSWTIINTTINKLADTSYNIYDIECDLVDFLQNYGVGIGLLQ